MNNWTRLFLSWLTLIAMNASAQTNPNTISSTDPVGIGTYGAASAGLHVKHSCETSAFKATVLFEGQSISANINGLGCVPTILNDLPVTGDGSRWMWLPDRGAVRGGVAVGTEWDNYSQIGTSTVAHGFAVNAISPASIALGWNARVGGSDPNQGLAGFAIGSNVSTNPGGIVIGLGGSQNVNFSSQSSSDPRYNGFVNVLELGSNDVLTNDVEGSIMLGSGSVNPTMILTKAPTTTGYGNVGIATKNPGSALQVNGGTALGYSDATAAPTNGLAVSGFVGIGTTAPEWPLEIKHTTRAALTLRQSATGTGLQSEIAFYKNTTQHYSLGVDGDNNGNSNFYIWGGDGTANDYRFLIQPNGTVGIGLTPSEVLGLPTGFKLHVNGDIRAKEVVIETDNWPDYVFSPTYPLRTIGAVEAYIQANGHLPDMPTATHLQQNGVPTSEIIRLLTQKVEELTLYVISLQKQLNAK